MSCEHWDGERFSVVMANPVTVLSSEQRAVDGFFSKFSSHTNAMFAVRERSASRGRD